MMKTYSVLIVEDEPLNREFITDAVGEEPEFNLLASSGTLETACKVLENHRPDIVLLDIQLPGQNGFHLLEHESFQALNPLPVVVFITAHDRYAVKAFDVHAVDYVLKPFDKGRLHKALHRAKDRIHQGQNLDTLTQLKSLLENQPTNDGPDRLQVKEDGRIWLLPVKDVDWIEAKGNYVMIHSKQKSYRLRETLTNMEQQLAPKSFVRVHRSSLVNINAVEALEPWFNGDYMLMLHDGQRIKLSRRYKEKVAQTLGATL